MKAIGQPEILAKTTLWLMRHTKQEHVQDKQLFGSSFQKVCSLMRIDTSVFPRSCFAGALSPQKAW